jgi:predicted GNAT family acetyltransferase
MTESQAALTIVHNEPAQRFEVVVDGLLCRADYVRDGDTLRFHHTEVPPALGGRGIAAALVRTALDHAQANGLHVVPACSYVRTYMQRHAETQALLPPGISL